MGFFDFLGSAEKKVSSIGRSTARTVSRDIGNTFHFLNHTLVEPTVNAGKNAVDVVNAGRQGIQGLADIGYHAAVGDKQGEQQAINRTQSAINYSLGASRGAYTPEEASSTNFGKSFVRPLVRNTATYAPYFVAPGAGELLGPEASVGARLATGSGAGGATSAAFNAAQQVADTGHIDPKQLAVSAATGAAAGLVGEGTHQVFGAAKTGAPAMLADETGGGNPLGLLKPEDISKLKVANSTSDVKKVLNDKLPPDVVDKVAPAIVGAKHESVVVNILNNELKPKTLPSPTHTISDVSTPVRGGEPTVGQGSGIPVSSTPAVAPPTTNAFDEIRGAISGAEVARGEQNKILSQERAQRFSTSQQAGATAEGSAGYFREKAALAGKYGQADYQPLIPDLTPQRAEELFSGARKQIQDLPDTVYTTDYKQYGLDKALHPGGARLSTQTAVRKVLGLEPGIPTDSELKLLRVVSPGLANTAEQAIPKGKNRALFDFASKLFGTSRSAKSTADFSMGGRQGLFVAARHPELWAKANAESVKFAGSDAYYKQAMKGIEEDPWIKAFGNRDLGLTGIMGHEEAYPNSDLLTGAFLKDKAKIGNIPAGAERAYTGGLTKLRADILKSRLQAYGSTPEEAAQALGKKGLDGLAEAVRTLTGRGGKAGGFVAKHATTLNEALFSPRLWASRLEPLNPAFWHRIGPAGRKEALESLGSFASVAGLVLSAAVAAGADVETDPRSSDFLKIKVGDTRYDILGGFQQNLVFGTRQLLGLTNTLTDAVTPGENSGTNFKTTKSSVTGKLSQYGKDQNSPSQLSAVYDLIQNKANPLLSSASRIIEGKDKAGNRINPLTEIGQLFVPISIQGSFDAFNRDGLKGIAKNSPDLIGIAAQTYGPRDIKLSKEQQKYVNSLKGDSAHTQAASDFYQIMKTGPDRNDYGDRIKQALQSGDQQKAMDLATEYNNKYKATFKDWVSKYGDKYGEDKQLYKDYSSNLITSSTLQRYMSAISKSQQGGG